MHAAGNGWNHNTHYHERLLQALPLSCDRALDVGCGRGAFTRRLAAMAQHVDAIDRDAVTIEQARRESAAHPNVTFIESDFMSWPAPATYDVVAMIATLHHLPFEPALAKADTLLRPGGTLIVLGLNRDPFLLGAMHAAVAYPVSWGHRITRKSAAVGAPIREPDMTLPDIRRRAGAMLPGAQIQRHLLWRYSLRWSKPNHGDETSRPQPGTFRRTLR